MFMLNLDERYQSYLDGKKKLRIDGEEYKIKEGDFIIVPANSTHHFHNNGKEILSRITFNPLISEPEI